MDCASPVGDAKPAHSPVETVNSMDVSASVTAKLATWWVTTSAVEKSWLAVGVIGQLMFSMRWVLQWLASEKARSSVVPTTFWYYSLVGGLMVLSYGIYRVDPVIILGQFGVLVYARNIYLLLKGGPAAAAVEPVTAPSGAPSDSAVQARIVDGPSAASKQ